MTIVLKKKMIVVVDNEKHVHDLINTFFISNGFNVTCFLDAPNAIKACQQIGHTWDILLTDFHFKSFSGIDFIEEINKIVPDLPIILITPPESAESVVNAIQKGAYDFIPKPISMPQLKISVERAIELKPFKKETEISKEKIDLAKSIHHSIIGKSPKFIKALEIAKRVANSTANIFITGESGTGKEVFAKFIHNESIRSKGTFVAINCSAIPESLLESELFGHAKGSFTGAYEKKIGLFEEAQNGTLFLDEIGDLSLSLQAKLLRVIQERTIKRVGENTYRDINCRIISATHKDLGLEVNEHRFREDLYFRLNVIPIVIPPLRDRYEDLIPLAENFLKRFAFENGSNAKTFSKEAIKFVLDNPWRGNVRELENVVERAVVLSGEAEISLEDFMPTCLDLHTLAQDKIGTSTENMFFVNHSEQLPTLDDIIQKYIEYAVLKNGGAKDKTAKEIGIDRKTLYKRLRLL